MGIQVVIRHTTHYQFDRPVILSPHVVRLRPAPHCRTPVLAYSLKINPEKHFLNWQQDPFGNYLARLVFPEMARELLVDVEVIVDLAPIDPFDFFLEENALEWPFSYDADLKRELAPYLEIGESGPLLLAYAEAISRTKRSTIDFLVSLNQQLCASVEYTIRMEAGVQSGEETLGKALGSCRDSAWLLVEVLRHLGLAARFVSGYLVQLAVDELPIEGPSGSSQDFTDLHAWAEVYIPGAGWIGLDPTSGQFASEGHIPLACAPWPNTAAPIVGSTGVCEVTFSFQNTVQRIREAPRVTRPYSDEQWAHIMAMGKLVDQRLIHADVRLTQGGEPTFVAIEDQDAPEWTIEALGDQKWVRAQDLIKRLRDRFAPNALLHVGQGKWYPGEPLPRWALGLYWRRDGLPLWQDAQWLANPGEDMGFGPTDAQAFAELLAKQLGLVKENVIPAYEDVLYGLLAEAEIPINVDVGDEDLDDPLERRKLADILSQGLGRPVGSVLPLAWDWQQRQWYSAPWIFRRDRLYLLPGNSPLGLRLPLSSLPWVAPEDMPIMAEPDPFAALIPLGPLEKPSAVSIASAATRKEPTTRDIPHTALAVEARGGCLYCFLPPVECLEHAVNLIDAIEYTAMTLKLPVVLEGYAPPSDGRLEKLLVTPDPGVIEVNIHPSASWAELVEKTLALHDVARAARLTSEKFLVDGRHTGTGGGQHVTLGGSTPADSPFLRRPDLLRSLITYWQHHPALSYFFNGLFVGPTSQAPRVDEARPEVPYELEIAFQQIPSGENQKPWLADRLFRHLLTDLTGNTHRSEFCIDKLYSPDSAAGRQGLVELRAFEMPPHPRMSLVQMLLLRALVAHFWERPYVHPLVRWGASLHDRFMLPHCLWQDLTDVVSDLQSAGFPFQKEWLAPFLEFRFPVYGRLERAGLVLELRAAIEPWNVLGEETTGRGTARYVDSSVERLQVRLWGATDSRYVVTCNGRRVPLQNTGVVGESVGGVRYRAWAPPSGLHPTIGIHAPLVFDLIDTWNGRSIGGCTYHIMHPGGRNPSRAPVNGLAAQARQAARFQTEGHSHGVLLPPAWAAPLTRFYENNTLPLSSAPSVEEMVSDYPYTLDLRRTPRVV